jgi:glycosyltransferase involved in cell wall biosynthesis
MVYCLRFLSKRILTRKHLVKEEVDISRKRVSSISEKPVSKPEFRSCAVDESMDLSVIIPVYNYETVLERMLQSVLNQQTKYRYEVIIVDDGSREPTKAILRKYENHPNVTVIYQQNQGISGARNTGLGHARGKYVMFVDCDDTIRSNMVERLMDEAYRSDVDIVIGSHALVKEKDGTEISRRDDIYSVRNLEGFRDGDSIMNYPGLPWGKVYKRQLFEQVRFPVNYWYEDTIVHFLLFRLAKSYVYLPEVFYDYRWYEGNYSKVQSKSVTRVVEHYWIVELMLEESRRIGLEQDAVEYKVVLRHLGALLYHAIKGLEEQDRLAVFNLACDLLQKNRVQNGKRMPFVLRELEASLLKKDYARWVLASTML